MPCILLTGATGYIASHMWLTAQEAGYDVIGVDSLVNSSPPRAGPSDHHQRP